MRNHRATPPSAGPGRADTVAAIVWVVLLVAFAARAAAAFDARGIAPVSDAFDYARHAHSIAAGNGYPDTLYAAPGSPTAIRPPALPHLLGGVEAVTGSPSLAPLLMQALLGTLAVALVWFIARELFGDRPALIAAGLAAIFPPLVLITRAPLTEVLFVPLELAVVALVLLARRSQAPWKLALAAGVLCGAAALTRQAGLFLLLPLAVGLFTAFDRRRAAIATAAAVAATVLVVAPWTARNAAEFDRFIPVALQDGFLLSGTYNPLAEASAEAPGAWRSPADIPELGRLFRNPAVDEAELNDGLSEYGREYLIDHPAYAVEVSARNTLRLFGLGAGSGAVTRAAYDEMGTRSETARDVAGVTVVVVALLALAGVVLLVRRRLGPLFVWLVPLILLATTVPIIGSPRYRAVVDPFLIMLAALTLSAWAGGRLSSRSSRPD